jgi:hypothetical protein
MSATNWTRLIVDRKGENCVAKSRQVNTVENVVKQRVGLSLSFNSEIYSR